METVNQSLVVAHGNDTYSGVLKDEEVIPIYDTMQVCGRKNQCKT
jgi:hypothetical protein